MKWLVAAPDYNQSSAGIRVMHRFAYQLADIGEEVALSAQVGNPDWPVPLRAPGQYPDDAIVVYPEIVRGNPFGARRVARYVLNHPGKLGGSPIYDPADLVIAYQSHYLESARAAAGHGDVPICYVDVIEPHLFNREGVTDRPFDAYYVGWRGRAVVPPASPARSVYLVTDKWPATRPDLARLLKSTQTLYCCARGTMLAEEAYRCGAHVSYLDGDRFGAPLIWAGEPLPSRWDDREDVRSLVARAADHWAPVGAI